MVTEAQQRAQDRASWATVYNPSTGTTQPAKPATTVSTPTPVKSTTTVSTPTAPTTATKLPAGFASEQQYQTFYNQQSITDQAKLNAAGYSAPVVATPPKWTQETVAPTVWEKKQETVAHTAATTQQTEQEKQKAQPDYQDVSAKRQAEIISNLNAYLQSNPWVFADKNLYKDFFDYGKRAPEQQKRLDTFWKGTEQGKADSTRAGYLNTLTWSKLANIGANDSELLKWTPKYDERIQAVKDLNKLDVINWEVKTETPATESTGLQAILDAFGLSNAQDTKTLQEQYDEMYQERVSGLADSMNAAKKEVDSYKRDYEWTLRDAKEQFKWSWATDSFIRAYAAKKQEEQLPEYQNAIDNYNNSMTAYNNAVSSVDKEMWYVVQQKSIEAQDFNQKLQALGFYYQYTPQGISALTTAKYQAENPNMDTGTPAQQQMALNQALTSYYDTYGSIIQRPQAQVVSDVLALAKSKWISVSAALKENFVTPLQAKPQYKAMIAKATGAGEISQIWDFYFKKDSNWVWQTYTPTASESSYVKPSGVMTTVKVGGVSLSVDTVWASSLTTALTQMEGQWLTAVVASGARTQDQQYALYGSGRTATELQAAGVPTKYANPTWAVKTWTTQSKHITGMAVDVYANASYDAPTAQMVADMNANGRYQPTETMSKWDYWHFEYTGWWDGWAGPTAAELAYYAKWAQYIKPSGVWWLTAKRYDEIAKWEAANAPSISPLSDDQRIVFNTQLTSFRSNAEVKAFEDAMNQYHNIQTSLENVSGPWDVSAIYQFMRSLDPTSVVRESEFNVAATSAGVAAYVWNTYNRLVKWEKLTAKQREAFGQLAKAFIINRWNTYDRLYDDMVRVTDNMWIDRSYVPSRATSSITSASESDTQQNYLNAIYQSFGNTTYTTALTGNLSTYPLYQ